MVVVLVTITLAIGCLLDFVSAYKNFDNTKFRENLITQAIVKMALVTILTIYVVSMR